MDAPARWKRECAACPDPAQENETDKPSGSEPVAASRRVRGVVCHTKDGVSREYEMDVNTAEAGKRDAVLVKRVYSVSVHLETSAQS